MAKAKRIRPPKVSEDEKTQVRARKAAGHDFALRTDEHGRQRLVTGTQEAARKFELTSGGKIRLRNVDPLIGISSLSKAQRDAGTKYRETMEACAGYGASAIPLQIKVDGGKGGSGVPEAVSIAHASLSAAREQIGHHEIVAVVDAICCGGMSIRELAGKTRNSREAILWLLSIGLDNLTFHYSIVSRPKQIA